MESRAKSGLHKGQTSVEYVVLIAVSILFFVVIIVLAYEQFANIGQVQSRDISENSLKKIAEAAKEVYLQGSGARKTVVVTFPPEVENNTINIMNNSLHLRHAGTDISIPVDFPVYGTLPSESGAYEILLISEGGQVRIGLADFSVSPSFAEFNFCQSNASQSGSLNLTFTNLQNYTLNITLTPDWPYTNVTISLSNSSLSLGAYASQIVTVTASLVTNVTGVFTGSIVADSANTSISIPVTVTLMDCMCYGGPGEPGICTNVSYVRIRTYSNSSYTREKVAFGMPPNATLTTGNWLPNSTITITITDPNSNILPGYPKNVQTNGSGEYTESFQIVGGLGTYNITINDTYGPANGTFILIGCQ